MTDVSIRCFLSAGELSSFSKAADSLFMTRQGVSRQILKLEKELGVQLFLRGSSSVTLTAAGKVYYDFFQGSAKQFRRVQRQANSLADANRDKLTINIIRGLDFTEYLRDITACLAPQPEIDYLLSFHDPVDLDALIEDGYFDLIISYGASHLGQGSDAGYDSAIIDHVGSYLAVSENHPQGKSDDLLDFAASDFASWQRQNESQEEIMTNTRRTLQSHGITVGRVNIYPNMESAFAAIEMGKAIGICSASSTLVQRPGIRTIPLEGSTDVICFWKSESENAVLRLISGTAEE